MIEFDRYINITLSEKQIKDWDVPNTAEAVKERFKQLFEKYGEDPEFFFTTYSAAVTDWVEKKAAGKKLSSLSSHFSTYLKKGMRKKDDNKKPDQQTEAGENKPVFSLDDLPELGENTDPFPVDPPEEPPLMTEPEKQNPEPEVFEKNNDVPFPEDPQPVQTKPDISPADSSSFTVENEESRLSLLDEFEEEEDNGEDFIKLEDAGFEKEKRKRSTTMTVIIIAFVLLIGAGIAMSVLAKMFDEKPKETEEPIPDYSAFKKGRVSNISNAMNKTEETEMKEQKIPEPEKKDEKKVQSGGTVSSVNKNSSSGGGYSKNAEKDREILDKYAEMEDPANSGGPGTVSAGRQYFVPGGSQQKGGVYFKRKTAGENTGEKNLQIHNAKIKVKLEFSIRSTAASTVVAIVKEGTDKIPAGAKFYGRATGYVNKRTQLAFSKLIIGSDEYTVKGFAISGRDPGIESEVTDISKENIDSSIKQGVVQTIANVANKYAGVAGGVAGDAATNTVDPASEEVKKQQEANKMTQEYRVPAGTSFFIYLE